MDHVKILSEEFGIKPEYVQNIITLLDDGNTIPFIARYRKEMHGTLDDQTIRAVSDRLEYLRNLDKRREEVYNLIDGMEKMTDEIKASIEAATVLSELEDIYRPFRPKRRTRASIAKEKGLEPLSEFIMAQQGEGLAAEAEKYIDEEKGVASAEDAIQGAMDIIAENVSDDPDIRKRLKNIIRLNAHLSSKATDEEKESVYSQYYDYSEEMKSIPPHRLLAINRGEKEGFLKVGIDIPAEKCLTIMNRLLVTGNGELSDTVKQACEDSYTRLLFPSLENELRGELTDKAVELSIPVFETNLRGLLMQPPVKGLTAIGLDPGFRTGCKVAVVDPTGRVMDTAVIYPTHSEAQIEKSKKLLSSLIKKYHVQAIAIGNGTASRETEKFTAEVLSETGGDTKYMIVNEAGASVYSASKLTLRSAVSIARRLQDPLAELVKIDPQSIGVGQYQHDMPAKQLSAALDGVVEDCVNSVGADLNTASPSLLAHIAGINKRVSENIVGYREKNGIFKSRAELKKVDKLGPKAFEQCAGFLRVPESDDPLDNTGVHPESYSAAKKLLGMCGYSSEDIKKGSLSGLADKVKAMGVEKTAGELGIGAPTLNDIVKELMKPGRDPRDELPPPILRTDVMDIKDLKEGMEMKGTVRNVIDFGAFVDIGVHQDGLVHISQISKTRIKHPSDVLSVGDIVTVKILSVDEKKGRISLTMKI